MLREFIRANGVSYASAVIKIGDSSMFSQIVAGKLLLAAAVVTTFISVAPALANPSYEAEEDYSGWRDAQRASVNQRTEIQNGPVSPRAHRRSR